MPGNGRHWKTTRTGIERLCEAQIACCSSGTALRMFELSRRFSVFADRQTSGRTLSRRLCRRQRSMSFKRTPRSFERCILMATDPGDLVLDPTCGSGTTAYVAEQWGRRWITIDTSRVALALARARIMGARYPYYLLADSREGQLKEAEVTRTAPSSQPVHGNIRQASSTSACRTSRSSPSPTTPRSTSSGRSGRRRWSRCARS